VFKRESGISPFVFLCDHSGRRIPARLNDLDMSQDDLKRHIAWDVGIEGVGRELSSHFDACLIMQPYSRLVIDCNRRPGSETSILAVSDSTRIPGNQHLSADDIAMRVREIFDPYHRKISSHLDGRRDAGRPTILVSLHSFTPVYADIPRPWHAGVLYNRNPDVSLAMFKLLDAQRDIVVGNNEPYSDRRNRLFYSGAWRAAQSSALNFGNSSGSDRQQSRTDRLGCAASASPAASGQKGRLMLANEICR
jgi:predicted N-formylglutamate amidohydrolase